MKKLSFTQAEFVTSALSPEHFPKGPSLPEIAIIGKSNVGKSSLINHLLKQKRLAKTSSTPGKTQTLNFFLIDGQCLLVDLPGYGFAKATDALRAQWAGCIDTYLRKRPSLKLVLFLLDIRREISDEDLSLIEWLRNRSFNLLLIFTKCDTVNTGEQQALTRSHLHALQGLPHLHYSIADPRARKQLIHAIQQCLT